MIAPAASTATTPTLYALATNQVTYTANSPVSYSLATVKTTKKKG